MLLQEEKEDTINNLLKYPFSRLAFITIRDPSQKTKWTEMSKIRTWIRRYSDDYVIVRGMSGGIHFHLLAGIKINKTIKPQKGIHFHIKYLNDKTEIYYDSPEEVQSRLKREYYRHEKFEEITSEIDINCQCIISQITAMIKTYWKRKRQQQKKQKVSDKKMKKIISVINYLQQNLEENKEPDHYINWW